MQKYEILALFPLTGTEEELKAAARKVEERLKTAGGTVVSSVSFQKGRLAYSAAKIRQGYFHLIQFEMDPRAVIEFRRALLLAGETLRFTITKVEGGFKAFVPFVPKMQTRPRATVSPVAPMSTLAETSRKTAIAAPASEVPKKDTPAPPTISMEELDRRLEEILGTDK